MAATTIDPAQLVHTYLSGRTAFMAEISNRLYGPPNDSLPAGITAPCKFTVFDLDGGASDSSTPVGRDRLTFHCYGATTAEARSVWRYLHDALQRAQGQAVTVGAATWRLMFASRVAGPALMPEPETGWPRVYAAYEITYMEWSI